MRERHFVSAPRLVKLGAPPGIASAAESGNRGRAKPPTARSHLSVHQTPSSDPAALLARLTATAVRHHSPCGDGSMVWRVWGEGPALVLLHGGYGSWTHWLRNIPVLSEGRRVIAADMPGLGESASAPEPYTAESIAAIVAGGLGEVLDRVQGEGESFDLAGFSFGGL